MPIQPMLIEMLVRSQSRPGRAAEPVNSILRADEEAARRVEAIVVDDAVAEATPVSMSKQLASEIVPNEVSVTVSITHAMGRRGC